MNQGRFRDYLNYLSMGPPSAQNWLRGWPLFNHGVHRFVNPQILGAAQMDPKVVFVTTCLIAGIGSIAMGIFANLPVALAPAMGLNAFFAFVVVGRWVSPADRDGRDILGRNWAIFAHAISYPVLDDLQHSIKFTYWYHQRNRIIYRLNGIKKYWRYCRQ